MDDLEKSMKAVEESMVQLAKAFYTMECAIRDKIRPALEAFVK